MIVRKIVELFVRVDRNTSSYGIRSPTHEYLNIKLLNHMNTQEAALVNFTIDGFRIFSRWTGLQPYMLPQFPPTP